MKNLIAAIIVLGAAADANAQSATAVMERAAKRYADMTSMSADFRQTITNPLTGTTAVSRGTLVRKDPNLLSITFSDPRGDRIVSDGTNLWVYLPSSAPGQVMKLAAGAGGSMVIDPGGLFLTSPASRYNISGGNAVTVGGRKTVQVNLVPKRSNNAFTEAKLWVDAADYSIRQFEIVDVNGLTRRVAISNVKANPATSSSMFRYSPPRGTRVIDG
jgi:outer membrane lipoprotein carrier protein